MIKAVIFDMDGVIINSEPFFLKAEQKVLSNYGHDVPIDFFYQYQGTTHDYMWRAMREEFNLKPETMDLVAAADEIRENLIKENGMDSIPYVLEFMKHLYSLDVPMAIASSSPRKDIEKTIEAFQLNHMISYYVSGDEVKHSKPAPDIFLKASKELNVEPENCLVIEDSSNGVKAGHAAGMKVIAYHNPEFPAGDYAVADKVINTFEQLDFNDLKEM